MKIFRIIIFNKINKSHKKVTAIMGRSIENINLMISYNWTEFLFFLTDPTKSKVFTFFSTFKSFIYPIPRTFFLISINPIQTVQKERWKLILNNFYHDGASHNNGPNKRI